MKLSATEIQTVRTPPTNLLIAVSDSTRLSTVDNRVFPVGRFLPKHSVPAERHVGAVTDCFHETSEDPSQISSIVHSLL